MTSDTETEGTSIIHMYHQPSPPLLDCIFLSSQKTVRSMLPGPALFRKTVFATH